MNLREMEQILNHGTLSDIREAMTSTDFYQFMQKGVKSLVIDSYQKALVKTTYQELTVLDTSDSNKEDYPSMGGPQLPRLKAEGMPYEAINGGSPDSVPVTNQTFGGIIELTSEADADDKTPGKALRKQAQQVGPNHAKQKDKVVYSILSNNPTIYDGGAFFRLNHPGYTGGANRPSNDNEYTAVTLSANALATVLGRIAQWEGADPDQELDVQAESLVVPITLQQTAFGLTRADLLPFAFAAGPLGPAATGGVGMPNVMKGKIGVITSHRLDRASLVDWFIKTSFPGFVYQPREGLSVMAEAANAGRAFSHGTLRWRTSERYRLKVINWRSFAWIS